MKNRGGVVHGYACNISNEMGLVGNEEGNCTNFKGMVDNKRGFVENYQGYVRNSLQTSADTTSTAQGFGQGPLLYKDLLESLETFSMHTGQEMIPSSPLAGDGRQMPFDRMNVVADCGHGAQLAQTWAPPGDGRQTSVQPMARTWGAFNTTFNLQHF